MTIPDADESIGEPEYDAGTQSFSTTHDWDSGVPVSTVVVKLVANLEEVPPTALDPLHDYVDPDALDRLVAPKQDGTPRDGAQASFRFEGYRVIVSGDGEIRLDRLD